MCKTIFAAFVMLLGFHAAAAAQTCPLPAIADTVELKPLPGSNLMTVPVAINGKPKQFLLALSANPDEISAAIVSELALPQVDQRKALSAMSEQNSTFQFDAPVFDVRGTSTVRNYQSRVLVASFTMGGATVPNLGFLVSGDRDMGKSKPYDGLLTASGFRKYDIDLDFGGRKLSFLTATGCTDPNQIVRWPHARVAVIPMATNNGQMSVPVTIDGHAIEAVIDTGSEHTVMRRSVAERVFGLKAADMTEDGDLRDGAGERVYRHTFPQIAFEGVVANNVPALIQVNSMVRRARRAATTGSRLQAADDPGDPVPELTLGMDVLHQLHLFIVFGQNKLYVTAAQ
ncbi:MAG: aspartyl protease family protein [Rhizomicrobium sp.]